MSRFQVLSDAQWELIAERLPKPTGREGRLFADAGTVVEGASIGTSAGSPGRTCLRSSGPGRRCGPGTWEQILAKLQAQADAEGLIERVC